MSTMKQLLTAFNNAKTKNEFPVVRFTPHVEELETYFDRGMKARVVSISEDDCFPEEEGGIMYKVVFDFSEFDEFNSGLEQANYYDSLGNPVLTATQAGWKPKDGRESIYLMEYGDEENNYFDIDDGSVVSVAFDKEAANAALKAISLAIDANPNHDINIIDLIRANNILANEM